MNISKVFIVFGAFILFQTNCCAQDTVNAKQKKLDDILNNVDIKFNHQSANDSLMNTITKLSKEDSSLKQAVNQYYLFGLEHRKRALLWNLNSSIIIFWSVIFLVLSGIVFAAIQFYSSLHTSKNGDNITKTSLATDLEASLQRGIKVSSPVLGVIILIISMLFFYLYLKYVYPITEVF